MCSGSGAPPSFEMCWAQHLIPSSLMTLLPSLILSADSSSNEPALRPIRRVLASAEGVAP
jgi:hypothetical protein